MPFDSLTIAALCRELNSLFHKARIDKIHQPERDELVLGIRTFDRGTVRLVISSNARWNRMHCDIDRRPGPTRPPAFCMLLRKYLEGGKIVSVSQPGLERIVHLEIEALNELGDWKRRLLICEFMGKHSNILLVNPENNLIIDAIKRYGSDVSSYREVYPGKEYLAPPPQNKLDPLQSSLETFSSAIWGLEGSTLAAALVKTCEGLSPFAARQLCLGSGLPPDMDAGMCGDLEFSRLYESLRGRIHDVVHTESRAYMLYKGSQAVDFAPYQIVPDTKERYVELSTINETLSRFYQERMGSVRLESLRADLRKKIAERMDRSGKKYLAQQGDYARAEENLRYRLWGDLLTAYSHQFSKGDTLAVVEDFTSGANVEIPLDPRFTPIQNAGRYYKTYNKSVGTKKHLSVLLKQSQEEIQYLESVLLEIEQADSQEELLEITEELEKVGLMSAKSGKKSAASHRSKPRLYISSDGLEILVGRNNRQNDRLTIKDASRGDLWLHSRQMAGSHVILCLPPSIKSIYEVPDRSLEEAAGLAAYYSRGRDSSKVEVDYTFRHQVQKPPGSKPGMVIYHQYWTIIIDPRNEAVQKLLNASDSSTE